MSTFDYDGVWISWRFVDYPFICEILCSNRLVIHYLVCCLSLLAAICCPVGGATSIVFSSLIKRSEKHKYSVFSFRKSNQSCYRCIFLSIPKDVAEEKSCKTRWTELFIYSLSLSLIGFPLWGKLQTFNASP